MSSGIGIQELVLLFVIGLLILGPERLPRVATQIGRWVGRARRTANQLRYQLEREIALADIEKSTKSPRSGSTAAGTDTSAEKSTASSEASSEASSDSLSDPSSEASSEATTEAPAEVSSGAAAAEDPPANAAPGDETIARPPAAGTESADDPAERA